MRSNTFHGGACAHVKMDTEFERACAMGQGAVYMTHVRYDQPAKDGYIRVR